MTDPLEEESIDAPSVLLFKKRSSRSKGNIRKRSAATISSGPDHDSDDLSSDDDSAQLRQVKRRHLNEGIASAPSTKRSSTELFPTTFHADRDIALHATNDATKHKTSFDNDTKIGPTKGSTNVRTTVITDYAPDVCKDYKTTGYCGYGSSCIYSHDRGNYMSGHQLDREWENVTKGRKTLNGTIVASARKSKDEESDQEDDDELENIPFACIICKEDYKSPIVTRCGHYYCEACALKRYRKNPACCACGADTKGVFNVATKLKTLLDRKRVRAERIREAATDSGDT